MNLRNSPSQRHPVPRFTYAADRSSRYARSRQNRHTERDFTVRIEAKDDGISH
jgi:hypothetical protein